jgi:cytochrome c oxidase subunit II
LRRKLTLPGLVAVATLATAGAAAAANGGFAPVTPNSPNAHHTVTAYWVIMAFTVAIFVLVEGLLITFIVKYRSRDGKRTDGAQVHGHSRLEVIWTVIPVVILCVIGIVVFIQLPHIANAPAAANPLRVTVEGHQYYWQFDYPDGTRTIGDLYVPVGRVVDLKVVSADVVHSWWIPELGGKIQALPGITNHTWFQAERPASMVGQCAELCGLYHASMSATVIASSNAEYEANLAAAANPDVLGKAEFTGVCATCHGMNGEGGYGPNLSNNPLLTQKAGLLAIVQNGRGEMPAVGNTWTQAQLDALASYVKTHVYKGAASGG